MELKLDQILKEGIEAHKGGHIEEAKRLYNSIINVQPRHPDANHNLGVIAISIGKTKQALPFFKTALESKPSEAQFWLSCIGVLIKLREWNDARAFLDQARVNGIKGEDLDRLETAMNHTNENSSQSEFAQLLQQAIVQRESGDFAAAIKLLTNYPNDFSNNVDLLSCLSHCYLLNDDIQNADIYLNKAKEIDSTNASVMWNDVRLLLATKNTPDALVVARKAIDLYPNDVEGIGVLGACLRSSKKIEEALLYLDKAVSLNPNYAEAFVNRGLIKLSTNDKHGALADLEIGLELKLHIRPIWNVVVSLNVEFERFDQAIYFLLKMVEAEPEDKKLFETLLVCINELGDEAMLDSYKNVLKIKPDSAEVHNNVGTTLFKMGTVSAAMTSFKQAIKINPFYADPYCNLATALAIKNDFDEAEDNYKQALKIQPDFSDAIYNLGKLFFKCKRYEEAAGHFKLVDSDLSQCDLLICLYELDQQSNFYDQLDYLMERGVNNAVIGSLVSRSKHRYGVDKPNPFCNDPLNYVLEIDLAESYDFKNFFAEPTIDFLRDPNIEYTDQGLLTNGIQTAGNIFTYGGSFITQIQSIIYAELEKYRLHFKFSDEGLIKNWPTESTLNGWLISMKSGGELSSHMHNSGWISGCIYINVPPELTTDCGNLVLELDDYSSNLHDSSNTRSINVVTGSLCLFPSSLLHHTIPFESEENRIVFVFDFKRSK